MVTFKKMCSAMGAVTLLGGVVFTTVSGSGSPVAAASSLTNFESGFTAGSPNGQEGWSSFGPYDHQIVENTYGIATFGTKSLRVSNAVTSGSFGDQTFSRAIVDPGGETASEGGGLTSGAIQPHFEASWDFASTVPDVEQPGLAVTASPDRGDGARMSWLRMLDTPDGLQINFFGYRDVNPIGAALGDPNGCSSTDGFFPTTVASRLDRTAVHTVKLTMDFLEGPRNDVVRVFVDGQLAHTDTSWEDYFRYCEGNQTRSVDSVLFRTSGTAVPATLGKGFLIDNLSLTSGPTVTTAATGAWSLYPAQSSTSTATATLYQAKVRAPINADGSSNFPKRRGVIPVQFDLESATRTTTTATVGPVVFESITTDTDPANDYSFLKFVPTTPMLFADLNNLTADYSFTTGNCGVGSLRWSVPLDTNGDTVTNGNLFVYFGTAPNFTDCTGLASNSGQNLIGVSDARFDLSQLGGPFYGTYADALALVGGAKVLSTSLVLDSGSEQRVMLTGASADGNVWAPQTAGSTVTGVVTTPFAKTCTLPAARIQWSKNDPTADGAINEADSIQPKDTGAFYRIVDCKYIYNLDVSSLDPNLSTRGGTYRVWLNIAGTNITNPAVFDLR